MTRTVVSGVVMAALSLLLLAGESRGQGLPIMAAIARAKQTGLPMLVIGVTDTCPHCVKLRQRLRTEPDLQPLLAQYVPIEIKAASRVALADLRGLRTFLSDYADVAPTGYAVTTGSAVEKLSDNILAVPWQYL